MVVGGLIVVIGYGLGGTTGFAINPARDLGPRLAHFLLPIKGKGTSDFRYALVPIAGPLLGGLLGAALYKIIYENQLETKYLIVVAVCVIVLIAAILKSNSQSTKT